MPNSQLPVVENYVKQWKSGALTDRQLIVTLVRKYAELSDRYEHLETKSLERIERRSYPMATCIGCGVQYPKKAWNKKFHNHACQMAYWRKQQKALAKLTA